MNPSLSIAYHMFVEYTPIPLLCSNIYTADRSKVLISDLALSHSQAWYTTRSAFGIGTFDHRSRDLLSALNHLTKLRTFISVSSKQIRYAPLMDYILPIIIHYGKIPCIPTVRRQSNNYVVAITCASSRATCDSVTWQRHLIPRARFDLHLGNPILN